MTIEVFFLVIALYIPSIIATAVSMSKPNTQTNKMFEYYSKLLPNTRENDFKIRKLIHAQKKLFYVYFVIQILCGFVSLWLPSVLSVSILAIGLNLVVLFLKVVINYIHIQHICFSSPL